MSKFTDRVFEQLAYPLAGWLARLGVGNSARSWQLLYGISPTLAGLTACLSTSRRASHVFDWGWPGPGQDDDLDGLLADISDLIEHTPAPGGLDTYWITVHRYAPVIERRASPGPDGVQGSAHLGKAVARQWVKGDRYYDWKKGDGRARARELLAWARPTSELQVTVVEVMVDGNILAALFRRWRSGR